MISDPIRNETMDNLLITIYQTADRTDMPTHQIARKPVKIEKLARLNEIRQLQNGLELRQSKMNPGTDEMIRQTAEMIRATHEMNRGTDEMIREADEMIRQTHEMIREADGSRRRMDEMIREDHERRRRMDKMNRGTDEMIRGTDEMIRGTDEMIREADEMIRRRTDERIRQCRESQQRPIRDSKSGYYESIQGHVLRICEAIRELFSKILSLFRIIH